MRISFDSIGVTFTPWELVRGILGGSVILGGIYLLFVLAAVIGG